MKTAGFLIIAFAMLAAACGDDAGSPAAADTPVSSTTAAATTTAAPTTTTAPPTTTTTVAPTTTLAGPEPAPVVPGADPDVDAIVEAYAVVFDSSTSYEETAVFLTDASGLEETVAKYEEIGGTLGGVTLEAREVGIAADTALVIYDFLFGGNPAYAGLEGDAVRTDDGWKVTREMFCRIMALARVGCP